MKSTVTAKRIEKKSVFRSWKRFLWTLHVKPVGSPSRVFHLSICIQGISCKTLLEELDSMKAPPSATQTGSVQYISSDSGKNDTYICTYYITPTLYFILLLWSNLHWLLARYKVNICICYIFELYMPLFPMLISN